MNNTANVLWAQLILDNKATIEDVPAQLQAGVSEVVAYFTKTAQSAESKPATEPTPTTPASTATTVGTTATTVGTTDTATAPAQQDAEGQQ